MITQIGRRIYYDKATGNIILDKGEMMGSVVKTSVTHDFETFTVLQERVRETVGVKELEYGQYTQDFAECNGYRINPQTLQLEFSYPVEGEQPQQPVYQKPLSEQIVALEDSTINYMIDLDYRVSMIELGL